MQVTVIRYPFAYRLDFRTRKGWQRVWIDREDLAVWDRRLATTALNELEYQYGIDRKNVRFFHFDDGVII